MENQDYLAQLLKILRNIKPLDMGWILQDMSQDFTFDPKILAYLCSELFQPEILLEELSEEDFRSFLNSLSPEIATYLYKNISGYRGLIDSMHFDKKFLLREDKGLSLEIVIQSCISTIIQLLEDSKINYNGMILYFYKLSCSKKEFIKEKIIFHVMESVSAINQPIGIVILCQVLCGSTCTLTFTFSNEKAINKEITFDLWGLYHGELFLEAVDGICKVSLLYENKIYFSKNIIITKKSKSLLQVRDLQLTQSGTKILGGGKIDLLEIGRKDSKVRYTVYCAHCNQFIYFGSFHLDKITFDFSFPLPEDSLEHSSELIVYFEYEMMSSVSMVEVKKTQILKNKIVQLLDRNSEDLVNIPIKLEYGKYYLFAISKEEFSLEALRYSLSQEKTNFPKNDIQKKRKSPLESFLEKEDYKFFAQEKYGIRLYSEVISNANENFSLYLENMENIHSMYIDIYEIGELFIHLNRFYSPISEKLQIWSEKKLQIPNEESKIRFYLSNATEYIKILKPREISNLYIKDQYYVKYNEDIEFEILKDKYTVNKKYYIRDNSWFSFSKNKIEKKINLQVINEIESRILNLKIINLDHLMILIYFYLKKYNEQIKLEYIEEKIKYLFKIFRSKKPKWNINLYGIAEKILSFKSIFIFRFPELFSYLESISKKFMKSKYLNFENYIFENLYNYLQ